MMSIRKIISMLNIVIIILMVKEFVIWYTDDGMGIYDIYRVFLYSEKVADFKEIKPSCGDDFINLNLNKKKRELISLYYSHNEAQRCITNVFVDENKLK